MNVTEPPLAVCVRGRGGGGGSGGGGGGWSGREKGVGK